MPSGVSIDQLGRAVIESVQHGTYPDSEEVISAEFPPHAIPGALKLFDSAREQIKFLQARVRTSSRDSAPDIDGWILQAKQLRSDIETAQSASRDILAKAERNVALRQNVHDADSKLHLLEGEVAFNESLARTLEQIQSIRHRIGQIHGFLEQGNLSKAIDLVFQCGTDLRLLQNGRNIRAIAVLQLEVENLRQDIVLTLTQRWHEAIRFDAQTVTLPPDTRPISPLATSFDKLGLLDGFISDLASTLEAVIIAPRLQLQPNRHERLLSIKDRSIELTEAPVPSDLHRLFDDLGALINFVQTQLPSSVAIPVAKILAPKLTEALISMRLSSAVPEELAALQEFSSTRDEVFQFAQTMTSCGWPGEDQLRAWCGAIPQVWLQKRQNTSLNNVRQLLKRGYGEIKTVERVETQVVSQQDHLFAGNASNDNWDAGWSDEQENNPLEERVQSQSTIEPNDEEDVSAWGLDDEGDEKGDSKEADPPADNDEGDDAWGWGSDVDIEEGSKTPQHKPARPSDHEMNGHAVPHRKKSERQLTLKESYNITSLPTGVIELIDNVVSDADALRDQSSDDSSATAVVPGLLTLPSLLLVMYRASASRFYSIHNNGNMCLYNDCLWLADQLRQMVQARPQSTIGKGDLRLNEDIAAIEAFGKRSYGKEMESQRTIIKDFLDGAQGFANCTEPPFSQECDLAINSIVDRLRDIHRQWKSILSHSALLQSVGSLLSTVIDKMIIDIEDMGDISEPESQRLTAYCKQVTALEDLFLPQEAASTDQEPVPLTAVYTPGWFKFQYLSEILDSSLVDIKYLWTDGGLKLEYDAEELVELIEALFADSEHRRRAIGEIRRASTT
ncbi:MAG: hypothetical protein Q9201_000516 [Fulgogasparrea decipioides]